MFCNIENNCHRVIADPRVVVGWVGSCQDSYRRRALTDRVSMSVVCLWEQDSERERGEREMRGELRENERGEEGRREREERERERREREERERGESWGGCVILYIRLQAVWSPRRTRAHAHTHTRTHTHTHTHTHTSASPFTNRVSASAPIVVTEPVEYVCWSTRESKDNTQRVKLSTSSLNWYKILK